MKKAPPVLMMQDVWFRWTKATRAAADAGTRLAVPRVHPLPQLTAEANEATIRHEVMVHESNGFVPVHRVGRIKDPDWDRARPGHPDNVVARASGERFIVSLQPPWASMLTTKWPAWLPSPLFEGGVGDSIRIDWNGRFRSSLFGSDRSYFFEEHTVWVTLVAAPTDGVFVGLEPGKHIDLRTQIY
ncbi:hypothetical protein G4G28_09205 [Massilia sp. Dwa41.01b]|uniref:hypothetical protein n=1 Tax=unclassified Massilia TaxID=2609279 RepID=UPI0015FFE0DB|nr:MULTISPECIES: hypothetical protein [unclassified Massilia]QNA88625.1 hypothetical protein G4G28_09205 [Massilia sp. Dwa41.01b]QNA99515.1 hypothetical protein G4G31_12860 [Massilia sp. Se16.2.3]